MQIIHFTANKQILSVNSEDIQNLVKGTRNYYMASFALSEDYIGCKLVAEFSAGSGKEYIPLIKNRCVIPESALKYNNFTVKLYGQNESNSQRIVTTSVTISQRS